MSIYSDFIRLECVFALIAELRLQGIPMQEFRMNLCQSDALIFKNCLLVNVLHITCLLVFMRTNRALMPGPTNLELAKLGQSRIS